MAKKKTKKEFEVWANQQLRDIQKILLTQDYFIDPIRLNPEENDISFSIRRYPYKDIAISYAENIYTAWQKGNKDEAYRILLHEMIHPITDKLHNVAGDRFISKSQLNNECEQLTDHFTNVIYNLIHDKKKR